MVIVYNYSSCFYIIDRLTIVEFTDIHKGENAPLCKDTVTVVALCIKNKLWSHLSERHYYKGFFVCSDATSQAYKMLLCSF